MSMSSNPTCCLSWYYNEYLCNYCLPQLSLPPSFYLAYLFLTLPLIPIATLSYSLPSKPYQVLFHLTKLIAYLLILQLVVIP